MNTYTPHIALVEDDQDLREELAHYFKSHDFQVSEANSGISLDDILVSQQIDVLVLDLNLPGQNGFTISERIRKHSPHIGIIMLTARTTPPDRLRGYEAGADIYLPKPTPPQELLAAVNNLTRRLRKQHTVSPWVLDTQRRLLYTQDRADPVVLTAAETALLQALIQAPNQTIESDILSDLIQATDLRAPMTKRALENLISRLRKKISAVMNDPASPPIRSVWGLGYQLTLVITLHKQ